MDTNTGVALDVVGGVRAFGERAGVVTGESITNARAVEIAVEAAW
jgi:hypothetical protein